VLEIYKGLIEWWWPCFEGNFFLDFERFDFKSSDVQKWAPEVFLDFEALAEMFGFREIILGWITVGLFLWPPALTGMFAV